MPELFYRLPENVARIFTGRNLLWHALAVVVTILILESGLDWSYFIATRGEPYARFAHPAIVLGTFLPVFGTLTVLVVGMFGKCRRTITTAWAMGQAVILGFLVSSLYKALTGRVHPPFSWRNQAIAVGGAPLVDSSHGFRFGFLRGGMFWGWPSSHTTVAFAMAVGVVTLHPKKRPLVVLAILYALYIGLGVSMSIHWLSEFVAGAIIGSLIGSVVGRSFRTRLA